MPTKFQAYSKHMQDIMVHVRRSLGALSIFFVFYVPGQCLIEYAWNERYMPSICQAYSKHMVSIYQAYSTHMASICHAYSTHIPSTCQAYAKHIRSICQAYTQDVVSILQAYAKHMPTKFQAYSKHMADILVHVRRSLGALSICFAFLCTRAVSD